MRWSGTGRESAAHRPQLRESFDIVVSRGVAGLPTLVELTMPFCRVGGLFVGYKGREAETELKGAARALDVTGAGEPTVVRGRPGDSRRGQGRAPGRGPQARTFPGALSQARGSARQAPAVEWPVSNATNPTRRPRPLISGLERHRRSAVDPSSTNIISPDPALPGGGGCVHLLFGLGHRSGLVGHLGKRQPDEALALRPGNGPVLPELSVPRIPLEAAGA